MKSRWTSLVNSKKIIEVAGDFLNYYKKWESWSPKQQFNNTEPGHADGLLWIYVADGVITWSRMIRWLCCCLWELMFHKSKTVVEYGVSMSLQLLANQSVVELVRNLVAHGDAREGKWRGNWRMEWVASTLAPSPNVVYPALLKLMRTPRLPAVDWTDAHTNLNGLVRFGERRNLVSAHVPSRSARAIPHSLIKTGGLSEILNLYSGLTRGLKPTLFA